MKRYYDRVGEKDYAILFKLVDVFLISGVCFCLGFWLAF